MGFRVKPIKRPSVLGIYHNRFSVHIEAKFLRLYVFVVLDTRMSYYLAFVFYTLPTDPAPAPGLLLLLPLVFRVLQTSLGIMYYIPRSFTLIPNLLLGFFIFSNAV